MNKYIAILRGINVSGQKLIKMTDLIKHLEELGFKKITTYIQSGNVLFESDISNQMELALKIGNKIKEKYGFDVPVIVKNREELKIISKNNPFLTQRSEDIDKLYVTILAEEATHELAAKFKDIDYKPDEFILDGNVLYGYVPNGYGNTKFSNTFIENKLKTTATTRNWKTVLKLTELGSSD